MQQDTRSQLFECQRCGKCCVEIGLPYDPESIYKIAEFLHLHVDHVIAKYYGRITQAPKGWVSQDHKRTPCPFLNSDGDRKSCKIYPVRPWGCELYPFETDFGRQDVDCPGARIVYEKLEKKEN